MITFTIQVKDNDQANHSKERPIVLINAQHKIKKEG